MTDEGQRLAYKVPEAAIRIGMSVRKCWALVHAGEIRSYKVGHSRYVSHQALLDWIEQQEKA
ncbi:helix-turn-helix domain-containing protein [Micromonospora marina]|uniref:helix-turn-helix domain-containing protein n=1 Tax=Micromonospora marina TaxID=307120 RepID=UPI00345699A2